jgi:phosphomannomutase
MTKFNPGIFKAYDIRGIYPEQIDGDIAYRVGQAFVAITKPQAEVMVGRDVRIHSEELKNKLVEGILDAGVDVCDVGLMSTDMLYFGVGNYGFSGGVQVTASHNPPEWHGAKMVRTGVIPISGDSGMNDIRDWAGSGQKLESSKKGKLRQMEIWDEYCKYVLTWMDTKNIQPMKVVINPNFGLAGKVFHKIVEMGNLPLEIVDLNCEPDGTFPKGRPDPFIPENRPEFLQLIKESKADLGITWDADADRVFFATEEGIFAEPYYTNTLLIKNLLKKYPGSSVIYDPRYTWATIDAIKENGGLAVGCRVGHSFIKAKMREVNAVFSGESSGHTYYRDYWYSDCGMIPPMQILEYLSVEKTKLSLIINSAAQKYPISGEINNRVENSKEIMEKMAEFYKDAKLERLDGLSIEYPGYRFNLRTSNTEPMLRLCLEAHDQETMEEKRDEVVGHIKEWGKFVTDK